MNRPINKLEKLFDSKLVDAVSDNYKPKILVGIPCMEKVCSLTDISVGNLPNATDAEIHLRYGDGSLVYVSRNALCQEAVEGDYTHLFFVDSDMVFPPKTLTWLLAHDKDIATAVCYARGGNHEPQVYTDMKPATKKRGAVAVRATDVDGVFPIKACGMAVCLIKVDLIRKMFENGINPFEPFGGMGEDFSFCVRAQKLGASMIADGTFPIGHIGTYIYTKKDWIRDDG